MATSATDRFTPITVPATVAAAIEDYEVPLPMIGGVLPTAPRTVEECALQCMNDNNMVFKKGAWISSNNQYYTEVGHPTATYRAAGFVFDATTKHCQLYSASALPTVGDADRGAASGTAQTIEYYDLNCMNSGTRTNIAGESAYADYCLCNQDANIPESDDNAVEAMFEGPRCTKPESWHHSNNITGSFNRFDSGTGVKDFQYSNKTPADHRWASDFPLAHPSDGYNVDHATGVPFPIAAGDIQPASKAAAKVKAQLAAAGDMTAVTAGATMGITPVGATEAPTPSNTPPTGFSYGASSSGQCGAAGACKVREMRGQCPTNTTVTCPSGSKTTSTHCCNACCPAVPPDSAPVASVVEAAVSAVGAATPKITKPPGGNTGTAAGGVGWCTDSNKCPNSTSGATSGACTSEPKSFKIAAKAFAKCQKNSRAMVHAGEQSAHDVSTWSSAQQNALSQILGQQGVCKTFYHADSHTVFGLEGSILPPQLEAGGKTAQSQTASATGCSSLFNSSTALAEYTATNNCILNSVSNCQSTIVANTQVLKARITSTGDNSKINITQKGQVNLTASANYTTEFTSKVANSTTQNVTNIVKQINKQLQAQETAAGIGIYYQNGQPPPQGPRSFASFAGAIQSITSNSVSNQISNKQVTNVTQADTMDVIINSSGAGADIELKQQGLVDAQVNLVTRNTVNNQLANTTVQTLTNNVDQDNEDKRKLGIIIGTVLLVLLVAGAIVAAVFLTKKAVKAGKKLFKKHASPPPPTGGGGAAAPPPPTA